MKKKSWKTTDGFILRKKGEQTAYVRSSSPLPLSRKTGTFKHVVRILGEISVTNTLSGEMSASFASSLKNSLHLCDQLIEKKAHLTCPKMSSHSDHYEFSVKWIGSKSGFGLRNVTLCPTSPHKRKTIDELSAPTCPLVLTAAASAAAAAFPSAATSPLDAWEPIVFDEFACLVKQTKKKN